MIRPTTVQYTRDDGFVHKKCICPSNYILKNTFVPPPNGCGPNLNQYIPNIQSILQSTLFTPEQTNCCNQHDRCIRTISDSGKCYDSFSKCIRTNGKDTFHTRLMLYWVNSASMDDNGVLNTLNPRERVCLPIHKGTQHVTFHWINGTKCPIL